MKLSSLLLVVLLSAATSLGVMKYVGPASTAAAPAKETAFERVMRTGTLRCAYGLAGAPRSILNDTTKQPAGGAHVEIMQAIASVLNLKIDWVEIVGYGVFPENLRSGKEDAFCSTVWTSAGRAHKVLLTNPIHYTPLFAFVRSDDARFDNLSLAALNSETITFSVMDGTSIDAVAKTTFPKAKRHALPLTADTADLLIDVATKKADIVVYNADTIDRFNQTNPNNKLRSVLGLPSIRTYGESFAVAMGEFELRELLNTAISELQNNGTIDRILTKYEADYGRFDRASDPFSPTKAHP